MNYTSQTDFRHDQQPKTGVLITNLGTPEAPTPKALKSYLREFLSDPRIVEYPRLLWWLVLNGIILNSRPRRSARSYASVWTEQGSPLLVHTREQRRALADRLGTELVVEFAMRYGNPSIASVVGTMLDHGVRRLLVLPLYPQYSATTTASTFDAIAADFKTRRWLPEMRFVSHYHDYGPFVQACATHIQQHWAEHGRCDKLLLSYHGIPKRYLLNGDPYHCQCHASSRLIAEALGLGEHEYLTTFQSRFGRDEWLSPSTDDTLKSLPTQGVKSVQVFCPGFSADCLETREEIDVENRHYFNASGGERFDYIPCLNAESHHIDALELLIQSNLQGWETAIEDPALGPQRVMAAKALGADR